MQEKLKGFFGKIKDWWKSAAKKTKILIGSGVLAVLVVIGIITAINLNQPYEVLFTDMNQEELSEVASYLSDNGVSNYRISDNNTIMVPKNQKEELAAALIVQGYPTSGYSHSTYFDNVGSLTTESERNTLALYDLQDSLEAVIRCLDGVSDATVQITPEKDNSYVLDKDNTSEAKASVMVVMKSGKTLKKEQVSGIRNFVSHAVKGLEINNVTILDSYGNSYSSGNSLNDVQDISDLKFALEEQVNNYVRTRVFQVLSPFYGDGNISVSVTSVVDVDRKVTESTDYNTEDWATDGKGIIGHEIWNNELIRGDEDTAGGVAGAEPNTDTNPDIEDYVDNEQQINGDETYVGSSGEKDYLVDQETTQTEKLAGTVTDLMVAVSINGTAGSVDISSLYGHIARAAGISSDMQEDKISILVSPFYSGGSVPGIAEPSPNPFSDLILYAAMGGAVLLLFLLILILVLVLRHRRRKALVEEIEPAEAVVSPEKKGVDIMDPDLMKAMDLRKDVRKFADDNPEIAAQMLRSWLREGDGKNE